MVDWPMMCRDVVSSMKSDGSEVDLRGKFERMPMSSVASCPYPAPCP